jgi:hypothetical protein
MSKGVTAAEIMKVSDQDKVTLYQEVMPSVMQYLAEHSGGHELSGDDLIDFLAMAIASVLDNDTYLTTPQDLRKGAEAAAKHIARWTRVLREHRVQGMSLLAATVGGPSTGGQVH